MKENVVIVVESEHGQKFGGYTSHIILETNQQSSFFLDYSAFVFSLTQQTKHKLVKGLETDAIYVGPDYIFCFGGGCDIRLDKDCIKNDSSYCNLGNTYEAPAGMTVATDPCKNYLAGSYNYKVREIEAF